MSAQMLSSPLCPPPGERARWRDSSWQLWLSSCSAMHQGLDSTYMRWLWWVYDDSNDDDDDDTGWHDAGVQRLPDLVGRALADRPLPPPPRHLRLLQRRHLHRPGCPHDTLTPCWLLRMQNLEVFFFPTSRILLCCFRGEELRTGFDSPPYLFFKSLLKPFQIFQLLIMCFRQSL